MSFDFYATKLLVNGSVQENYRWIYAQTNEHLRQLYSSVDFNDKNVLSVAASGDQSFLAYALGAKHIDLFDINQLTFYYYYLRVWTIKYFNRFYPKIPFHKRYLNDLLQMVKTNNGAEIIAFDYWNEILNEFDNKMLERIFVYVGKHLDVSKSELSVIKDSIDSDESIFHNIDMSNYINIKEKYDIVITSNIVDWLHEDIDRIEGYKNNLCNLLNDNGIVLCSDLSGRYGASNVQKRIFEKEFDYYQLPDFKRNEYNVTPGYVFQKKR